MKSIWVVLAIAGLPLLTVLGNLGYFFINQEDHLQIIKTGPDQLGIFVLPVMLLQFTASLVTSPLFEEPGWRGFALGPLQERYGRTLGSLVVALLWWAWHQPMNLTFGLTPSFYSALSMVVLSFIIDSLFNLSNQNLFTAMLAHQSSGTVNTFFNQGNENWLTLILKIIFLMVIRRIESIKKAS
ncbi:MAG: CPBP family intramembrane metalloprotease [Anaerolineales bacterium]|nr:CPBP family intramembrane metalloprotease [Anaerolineales bacterium]